jgi:hypothetical protein
MADLTVFQVDQAEPENQIITWPKSEHRFDADRDSHVLLSAHIPQ